MVIVAVGNDDFVNCRIGSLEIEAITVTCKFKVNCRIGSLEK